MNRKWNAMPAGYLIVAVILFAAVASLTRAQEKAATQPLTLEQAVRMALQQNPAFQTSTDEGEAARARLKQVQAAWYPRFDFHQDFTRGNNPVYVFGAKLTQRQFSQADFAPNSLNTPAPLDNFQTRIDGRWMLFDSRQTQFHQRGAKHLVTAADFETEQARQDHGFRRYRDTYLRNRTNCPEGVYKFWLGHSTGGDMSEHYDKIGSDKETQFRRDVAASVGYGFTLPEQHCDSIVPRKAICSKKSKVAVAVEV